MTSKKRTIWGDTDTMTRNKRSKVVISIGAPMLPDELMMEVFLRLPIKSILRFRSVCRSWAAALSSEEFRSLHTTTAKRRNSPKLFFISPTAGFDSTAVYDSASSGPDDGLLFTLDDASGDFLSVTPKPCHGLSLLHDAMVPAYYVFNAATRAVTRLPPCQDVPHATAGLGFDARTKEHKVVRLFLGGIKDNQPIKCEVYTLGGDDGDCWRPAARGVPFKFRRAASTAIMNTVLKQHLPVFADGFLYWLIAPEFVAIRPRTAIISFSVTDETFRLVPSPPFEVPGVHLVELDDQLCMVRDLRNNSLDCSMLEIWKLSDLSSGDWSLKHRIDLLENVAQDLIEPQIIKILGSAGSCGSGKKVIIATSKRKVITYDPMSETLETVLSIRESHSSYRTEQTALRVSLFEESLAPVHKTNEEIALSSPLGKATKEILLRLPGDFVMQFKLVCKQWLRLIESEGFIRAYRVHNYMDRRPKIMLVAKGFGGSSGFSFAPLEKLLRETPSKGTWLDRKVVCSKPCHGMNLISTEVEDYLYNPCTGNRYVQRTQGPLTYVPWKVPSNRLTPENHAFTIGDKNSGLGFDPLTQEHVIVEMFYLWKDFKTRQYFTACNVVGIKTHTMSHNLEPPLPVNDMPPAYVAGLLYWMSEPRLGQSNERSILSFDIATRMFDVIRCPPSIAMWNSTSHCQAFVVELEGMLCAVLSNPPAEELDIWKLDHGQWERAYKVYLKGWSGYSLVTNIVVPMYVDPKDGRILLSTGKKLGLYNRTRRIIEDLYGLDELLCVTRTERSSQVVYEGSRITKCSHSGTWKSPLEHNKVFHKPLSALSGNHFACSSDMKSLEEINPLNTEIMPLVPMLYEESLAGYSHRGKMRLLDR